MKPGVFLTKTYIQRQVSSNHSRGKYDRLLHLFYFHLSISLVSITTSETIWIESGLNKQQLIIYLSLLSTT